MLRNVKRMKMKFAEIFFAFVGIVNQIRNFHPTSFLLVDPSSITEFFTFHRVISLSTTLQLSFLASHTPPHLAS